MLITPGECRFCGACLRLAGLDRHFWRFGICPPVPSCVLPDLSGPYLAHAQKGNKITWYTFYHDGSGVVCKTQVRHSKVRRSKVKFTRVWSVRDLIRSATSVCMEGCILVFHYWTVCRVPDLGKLLLGRGHTCESNGTSGMYFLFPVKDFNLV